MVENGFSCVTIGNVLVSRYKFARTELTRLGLPNHIYATIEYAIIENTAIAIRTSLHKLIVYTYTSTLCKPL